MKNLFHFVVPPENNEPETDMGWYYINASPKEVEEVKEHHIILANKGKIADEFNTFIDLLKQKYQVDKYEPPFHFIINY